MCAYIKNLRMNSMLNTLCFKQNVQHDPFLSVYLFSNKPNDNNPNLYPELLSSDCRAAGQLPAPVRGWPLG